ncbi:hypothetical protein ESCO_002012 [Escovopsis weberi]|uniref:Heterokaryon incompatibility domain-containing protein n=1 Tax=Escovopsis weberi TaxID=150374 RepID=A0A0M9VW83_ESCWE|nr:hypothetical protein ESCO_002012 [Escovopsis weberi]
MSARLDICSHCSRFFAAKSLVPLTSCPDGAHNASNSLTMWVGQQVAQDFLDSPSQNLHYTLGELARARGLCPCCAVIWAGMKERAPEIRHMDRDQTHAVLAAETPQDGTPFRLGVYLVSRVLGIPPRIKFLHYMSLTSIKPFDIETPVNEYTWLRSRKQSETIASIQKWYWEHLCGHDRASETLKQPKYLLQIRESSAKPGDSRARTCVLVEAARFLCRSDGGHYAAICHPFEPERYTTLFPDIASIDKALETPFPWSTLPARLQQAFDLLLKLKMDLVWIDDPFIYREERARWDEETFSLFDAFYHAAFTVTLLAGDTPASQSTAAQTSSLPCVVEPQWADPTGACALPSIYRLVDRASYWHRVKNAKLITAGCWRVHLFASRLVLHVAEDQLWWTSGLRQNNLAANESCSGFVWEVPAPLPGEIRQVTIHDIAHLENEPQLQRTRWIELVKMLHAHRFFHRGDAMRALGFVLAMFAERTGRDPATNYFGLWADDWFLQELLWCSKHSRKSLEMGLMSLPSWSWTSVRPADSLNYMTSRFQIDWPLEAGPGWEDDSVFPSIWKYWTANFVEAAASRGKTLGPPERPIWASNDIIRLESPLIPAILMNTVGPSSSSSSSASPAATAAEPFQLQLALKHDIWRFAPHPLTRVDMDDINVLVLDDSPMKVVLAVLRCHVYNGPTTMSRGRRTSEAHGLVLRGHPKRDAFSRIGRVFLAGPIVDYLAKPDMFTSGWLWEEIGKPELYGSIVTRSNRAYGHLVYDVV